MLEIPHKAQPMSLLTIEEAARLLQVKISWLYERTRTNEVPHLKLGKYLRFDQGELLAWVRQFRRDGRGRDVSSHRQTPAHARAGSPDGVNAGRKAQRSSAASTRFQ
jgi:excisionase family DNA binding protein